jgi:hypothetical protein
MLPAPDLTISDSSGRLPTIVQVIIGLISTSAQSAVKMKMIVAGNVQSQVADEKSLTLGVQRVADAVCDRERNVRKTTAK